MTLSINPNPTLFSVGSSNKPCLLCAISIRPTCSMQHLPVLNMVKIEYSVHLKHSDFIIKISFNKEKSFLSLHCRYSVFFLICCDLFKFRGTSYTYDRCILSLNIVLTHTFHLLVTKMRRVGPVWYFKI